MHMQMQMLDHQTPKFRRTQKCVCALNQSTGCNLLVLCSASLYYRVHYNEYCQYTRYCTLYIRVRARVLWRMRECKSNQSLKS